LAHLRRCIGRQGLDLLRSIIHNSWIEKFAPSSRPEELAGKEGGSAISALVVVTICRGGGDLLSCLSKKPEVELL
jgi:hypothetical protein